jgi:TetR/AcrR family transcriptional regulator, copper-responsive repressor
MGRPKNFSRDEVLEKALPVFWRYGFADTSVQELEQATGVNKSGLYSEFAGKEDLFLASLRYYLDTGQRKKLLAVEPLGWDNVERFLKLAPRSIDGQKGCFCVSSMRELAILPPEAAAIMNQSRAQLRQLIAANIAAARPEPKIGPEELAELVLTFFTGISTEQYLSPARTAVLRRVDNFMKTLRGL